MTSLPGFHYDPAAAATLLGGGQLYRRLSEEPSTRRLPRHLLAITHAADTDTYIDTAHRSLPRYLTAAADARWNKAKKRESAPKDKFATQSVVFQGTACTTDSALTVFNGICMMMQYGTKYMTKARELALKGVHSKDNMLYLILYIILTSFKHPATFGTNPRYK